MGKFGLVRAVLSGERLNEHVVGRWASTADAGVAEALRTSAWAVTGWFSGLLRPGAQA